MGSNLVHARGKNLAVIGSLICAIVMTSVALASSISDVRNKPELTYEEHSSHYLPIQKTIISIIVRNEGLASAEQVEIKAKANAEIENIIALERDIAGEKPWFELSGESVDADILKDSSGVKRLGIIKIPYIAKRTKYLIDLIIKSQDGKLIQEPIVECKNDGRAEKYIERGGLALTWLVKGFAAGVILTVASVFLRKGFKRYRRRG